LIETTTEPQIEEEMATHLRKDVRQDLWNLRPTTGQAFRDWIYNKE